MGDYIVKQSTYVKAHSTITLRLIVFLNVGHPLRAVNIKWCASKDITASVLLLTEEENEKYRRRGVKTERNETLWEVAQKNIQIGV